MSDQNNSKLLHNDKCIPVFSPIVAKEAIDFEAAAVMPDNSIKSIRLSDYRGKKIVLLFYPLDFTFVCPTEILAFNEISAQLEAKNTVPLLVSVDSEHTHLAYKNTAVEKGGIGHIKVTMVADIKKQIARDYGILWNEAVSFRGTIIIDEHFKVRHVTINDLPIGRNMEEIVRLVDAIEHVNKHGEVCPAGWNKGDKAMQANREGMIDFLKEKIKSILPHSN